MIEKKREDYSRKENNTLDWEEVFSNPETGLIPLLSSATNDEKLQKVFELIIQFLFARDGDASFREIHIADLKRFSKSEGKTFEESLSYAKEILRKIKNDRIEIAKNYIPKTQANVEEAPTQPAAQTSMQDTLINIIINDYRKTLEPITLNEYSDSLGKLPFIFSALFHKHFFHEMKDFCLREIAADCDVLISKKPRLKKDFDKVVQAKTLKGMSFRDKVWDSWRQMWDINTKKRPVPIKPKAPSGVSAVGNLFSKKYDEELAKWKRKARIIKAHNKKISHFYKVLCAEHNDYAAPKKDEVMLLVKTFGKTEDVFERHITALKQFLEQDTEHLARTFSRFIDGRNIDLALLYVLYENPDFILGETNVLKYLMRSYKEAEIKLKFPYTYRYLKEHMF